MVLSQHMHKVHNYNNIIFTTADLFMKSMQICTIQNLFHYTVHCYDSIQ